MAITETNRPIVNDLKQSYFRHRDEKGLVRLSVLADDLACPDCCDPFPSALADVLTDGFALTPDDDGHPCLEAGPMQLSLAIVTDSWDGVPDA